MNRVIIVTMLIAMSLITMAEEMHGDHAAHSMHSMNDTADAAVPEGAWSPTGMEVSQAQRCSLAVRGVVMLDNAAWAACGGKPAAVAQSVVPSATHHHAGH